jgi:hypothetical protein
VSARHALADAELLNLEQLPLGHDEDAGMDTEAEIDERTEEYTPV